MKAKDKGELRRSPPTEKMFFDNRIKRKNVLALNEKVAAIREYEKMPVYKRVGRMFRCSPDQIKRIVQQKDSILKAWEQRTRRCQDAKTLDMKVVRVSMLGKAVYDWIRRMMYYKDFQITDGLIQKMALQFKSAMGLQNFFPHQEWCDKFRSTYKICENDSKLLKIGYAQGYSVQIKDIVKDVLTECTPKIVVRCDDDQKPLIGLGGAEERLVKPLANKDENTNERSSDHRTTTTTSTTTPTTTTTAAALTRTAGTKHARLADAARLTAMQPLRQFVTLPIQTNSTGPQKVLVATPIMPPGQTSSPMTMTIIPLATVAKTPNKTFGNNNNNNGNGKNKSNNNNNCSSLNDKTSKSMLNSLLAAADNAACEKEKKHQSGGVPSPILTIKKEIMDEPDEVQIKQEFISDDEQETADLPQLTLESIASAAFPTTSSAVAAQSSAAPSPDSGDSALANVNSSGVPQRRAAPAINKKPQPPAAAAAAAFLGNSIPPLPPLTRAPATQLPPQTMATRTAQKRQLGQQQQQQQQAQSQSQSQQQKDSAVPQLTPIRSCAEARLHLKLLEEFALTKENFRLIGLLTHVTEMLGELDGNDDVDID